jgi:hypothetical protein
MSEGPRYRIDEPNVTSEAIDGEVIIVNLVNGYYYSAVELGAYVWGRISAGVPIPSMVGEISGLFDVDADVVERDLASFITKLREESLVVPAGQDATTAADERQNTLIEVAKPSAYAPPDLTSYSDMQDLLLLDPIHDVADVGWPTAKPESTG